MVRPKELVDGVLYTLQQSDDIPDSASFVGFEPDIDSQPINLPLIEVSIETQIEVNEMNTDFVGFRTDDDGNRIGSVYETLYTQEMTVASWTAQGSAHNPRDIGNYVRDALYSHDTSGPNKPLRNPDDNRKLDDVWRFEIIEGEHTDDLGTSPTLRRWEERIEISASEQYITDGKPIEGFTLDEQTQ